MSSAFPWVQCSHIGARPSRPASYSDCTNSTKNNFNGYENCLKIQHFFFLLLFFLLSGIVSFYFWLLLYFVRSLGSLLRFPWSWLFYWLASFHKLNPTLYCYPNCSHIRMSTEASLSCTCKDGKMVCWENTAHYYCSKMACCGGSFKQKNIFIHGNVQMVSLGIQ